MERAKNGSAGQTRLNIDWNKRPSDDALVHRPSNYGEISEVTV